MRYSVCSHLRFAMFSLEQTKVDLMESMGESRKRKDEIEVTLAPLQDFTPLQICPPDLNLDSFSRF